MSVNFVDGNIFSRLSTNKTTYICQQVNCKGVMGAGLSMQICIQWPVVYRRYLEFCYENDGNKLGTYQEVLEAIKAYAQELGLEYGPVNYFMMCDPKYANDLGEIVQ